MHNNRALSFQLVSQYFPFMLQVLRTLIFQTLGLDTHCCLWAFAHVFPPPEMLLSLLPTPLDGCLLFTKFQLKCYFIRGLFHEP